MSVLDSGDLAAITAAVRLMPLAGTGTAELYWKNGAADAASAKTSTAGLPGNITLIQGQLNAVITKLTSIESTLAAIKAKTDTL